MEINLTNVAEVEQEDQKNKLNPLLSFSGVYSKPKCALLPPESLLSQLSCVPPILLLLFSSNPPMRICSIVVGISCASPDSSPFGLLYSHLQTHLMYEILFHSHFALMQTAQGAAPRAAPSRSSLTVQGMTQPGRRQEKSGLRLACVWSCCRAEGLRDAVAPQGLLSTKVRGKDKFSTPGRAQTWPFHATWWQSQLLGAKPPVPSAHQMDAHVPERAAITSSASLPLRQSNAAPKCAMLQSRDCL